MKIFGPSTPKVFDLAKDPDERKDLYGKPQAEIAARMLLDPMWILRQWNVEWKKAQWGNAADVSSRFAADLGEARAVHARAHRRPRRARELPRGDRDRGSDVSG